MPTQTESPPKICCDKKCGEKLPVKQNPLQVKAEADSHPKTQAVWPDSGLHGFGAGCHLFAEVVRIFVDGEDRAEVEDET